MLFDKIRNYRLFVKHGCLLDVHRSNTATCSSLPPPETTTNWDIRSQGVRSLNQLDQNRLCAVVMNSLRHALLATLTTVRCFFAVFQLLASELLQQIYNSRKSAAGTSAASRDANLGARLS